MPRAQMRAIGTIAPTNNPLRRGDRPRSPEVSGQNNLFFVCTNAGFAHKLSVFSCQFSVRATGLLAISSVPNSCFYPCRRTLRHKWVMKSPCRHIGDRYCLCASSICHSEGFSPKNLLTIVRLRFFASLRMTARVVQSGESVSSNRLSPIFTLFVYVVSP